MPKYLVNLHVKGTLDDEGLEIESVEEMAPKPWWKRFFLWLWETSWQVKVFIIVVLGIVGYGSSCAIAAGSIHAGFMCLQPITDRITDVITGLLAG